MSESRASFALAFAAFFASQAIPARPTMRWRLVGARGERGFPMASAAVSLWALAWPIAAAGLSL